MKLTRQQFSDLVKKGIVYETFTSIDMPFVIDITQLREKILNNPKSYKKVSIPLFDEVIEFIYSQREIDDARVNSLTEQEISEPIIVVPLPAEQGGGVCPIDGHHRMVRLYKDGKIEIEAFYVTIDQLPRADENLISLQWGNKEVDMENKNWKKE